MKDKTPREIVLEKLKAIPDQNRFLKMNNKTIKISAAVIAVEKMEKTGEELVDIYVQNEKIHHLL